jgi:ABC-2 type transport system permease protein
VGLWAKGFEQLNVLNIFLIMPLSYLGGVFYSITMLPDWFAGLVRWNPFYYFIDGIRYSMIGVSESNLMLGVGIITFLIIGLSILIAYLFNIGYGIRE